MACAAVFTLYIQNIKPQGANGTSGRTTQSRPESMTYAKILVLRVLTGFCLGAGTNSPPAPAGTGSVRFFTVTSTLASVFRPAGCGKLDKPYQDELFVLVVGFVAGVVVVVLPEF